MEELADDCMVILENYLKRLPVEQRKLIRAAARTRVRRLSFKHGRKRE
jgi:hypothetical protein